MRIEFQTKNKLKIYVFKQTKNLGDSLCHCPDK